MHILYPLKFTPILKEKIWGGNRLRDILNKVPVELPNIGESWELSAVKDNLSTISNGSLIGENIEQVITAYKGDLVGEKVYKRFGSEFPLLLKFIDANEYLSIQVHPDDDMAKERHNSFGKTEMWYIVDAEKDAVLIAGFNQSMNKDKYLGCMKNGTLKDALNFEKAKRGDVFFMPAGRIHATGPGILFAEIQQTSDITYRIYDWDRLDVNGNSRELHTELAVDAIDYSHVEQYKSDYSKTENQTNSIVKSSFFTTNMIEFDTNINKDFSNIDSFVAYMALEGSTKISYGVQGLPIILEKGETILIPNCIKSYALCPLKGRSKVLEVYID